MLSRSLAVAVAMLAAAAGTAEAASSPYVAVVECEDSYAWSWEDTHASSQGIVGLANLLGVPYETLELGELLAMTDLPFTSVWFSQCPVLDDASYAEVDAFLVDWVAAGGNVFLDGPIGNYRPDPQGMFGVAYRGMDSMGPTLKIIDGGWFPMQGYQVSTAASSHPIAARMGIEAETPLSLGLLEGIETIDLTSLLDPNGSILLEISSPDDPLRYPYLVATTLDSGSRVVAVSAYGNYVGPATSFHNEEPAGFFDSRVLPYLLESLHWLEQPANGEPMVGLQLSHASMTAIGRLDGDWSNDAGATEGTFLYLLDAARTTGLTSVYGIVSTFVPDNGWEQFRLGGMQLEELGGVVGSHSATHNDDISATLDQAGFKAEITDSLTEIRDKISGDVFNPAVTAFINPGDTIREGDYGLFMDGIEIYMSHGFETAVPYSTGVMSFGDVPETVVVNNVPAPDYQWLYLEDWVYTVEEAASYQAEILDYYQNTVKRGVLYNEMWHDYAIGANLDPIHYPNVDTVRPLFDVNIDHFASNEVYMPSIDEVVGKFHIAQKARHTSSRDGDTITVTIDYAAVPARYRPFASGMGVRLNRPGGRIASVTVDGAGHQAFTRDTVILPPPSAATQQLVIELGAAPDQPRLEFTSKPIDSATLTGDDLDVAWSQTGLYRKSCVVGPETTILIDADSYGRSGGTRLCAEIPVDSTTTGFSTTAIDSGSSAFFVDGADRPLTAASIDGQTVTLEVGDGGDGALYLRTGGPPIEVRVNDRVTNVNFGFGGFVVEVPDGPSTVELDLLECEDVDGDEITNCRGDCDDTDPNVGVCDPPGGCCQTGTDSRGGQWLLIGLVLAALARRRRR